MKGSGWHYLKSPSFPRAQLVQVAMATVQGSLATCPTSESRAESSVGLLPHSPSKPLATEAAQPCWMRQEVPLPVRVAMQMGKALASWNDSTHWPEKPGSRGSHLGGCWKCPSLFLSISLQAGPVAHTWVTIPLVGNRCKLILHIRMSLAQEHRGYGCRGAESGQLAGFRHPSIYKEGN